METIAQLTPGVAVTLGAGVRRIVAPNAGLMTGPGTNTYLLGTRDLTVLDPGPNDDAHLQAILSASGGGAVRWILVTHTHGDHSPLAAELAAKTGARLIGIGPPNDGRQDTTFRAHYVPSDGERLTLGEIELTAVHTPGHASNCVCYWMAQERLMFTGDHVLEGVSPVILPPDGDMADYLRSLEKLLAYEVERIAPGHGGLMDRGRRVIELLRAHRLARESKVMRFMRTLGTASLDQLIPLVYDDVPADRRSWAKLTLEAHLIKLVHDGRVVRGEGSWRVSEA
jgi:glyoxylase-like metal-dependent hydrolase (beta-lactamase superfamily II)